jgi:hypothetical protein
MAAIWRRLIGCDLGGFLLPQFRPTRRRGGAAAGLPAGGRAGGSRSLRSDRPYVDAHPGTPGSLARAARGLLEAVRDLRRGARRDGRAVGTTREPPLGSRRSRSRRRSSTWSSTWSSNHSAVAGAPTASATTYPSHAPGGCRVPGRFRRAHRFGVRLLRRGRQRCAGRRRAGPRRAAARARGGRRLSASSTPLHYPGDVVAGALMGAMLAQLTTHQLAAWKAGASPRT